MTSEKCDNGHNKHDNKARIYNSPMWTFGKIIMFLESCWNSLNWQIRWRYYNFCVVMQWCNFNLILIKMIKTAKRSDSFHPLSHLHFHITKYFFSKDGTLFNFLIPFFKIWHTSTCQAVIYLIISIWFFFFLFAVTAWFDISTQFHYGHADKENENAY